jgi:hypothetical protein
VIVAPAVAVELGNDDPRDMVLFIGLVHEIFTHVRADGRIENLLLNGGMNLELGQGFADDFLLLGRRLGFFEAVEQLFDLVMILHQNRDSVILRQQQLFEHEFSLFPMLR